MPYVYGSSPSGRTTWRGDSTSKIEIWDSQAGAANVNNKTADVARFALPTRSGRWNPSRRNW